MTQGKAKPSSAFDSFEAAAEDFARYKKGVVEGIHRWTDTWFRARIRLNDGKTFCEITRSGEKWVLRGPPKPHVLFRLAEVPAHGTVFVCEGEKAADVGWSIGLPCVTSGGASSAGGADWSTLKGRDIVILPDHDEQGTRYANQVVGQLKSIDPSATIRILRLPELTAKQDLFEFVHIHRAGCDPALIRAEVQSLAQSAPEAEPSNIADSEKGSGTYLVSRCIADVTAKPIEWLWKSWIAIGKVTLIAGDPGLGKSFLTLDIAARVSAGRPFPDNLARIIH